MATNHHTVSRYSGPGFESQMARALRHLGFVVKEGKLFFTEELWEAERNTTEARLWHLRRDCQQYMYLKEQGGDRPPVVTLLEDMQKFDKAELNRVRSHIQEIARQEAHRHPPDFNDLFASIQKAWDEQDLPRFDAHVRELNNTWLAVQEVDLVIYPRDSFREKSLSLPPQWDSVRVGCQRYFPTTQSIETVTCESLVALLAKGAFVELSIPSKGEVRKPEAVKKSEMVRKTNKLRFLEGLSHARHSVFEDFQVIMMFNGSDARDPPCNVAGQGGKVFLHFRQENMEDIPDQIHALQLRSEQRKRKQAEAQLREVEQELKRLRQGRSSNRTSSGARSTR